MDTTNNRLRLYYPVRPYHVNQPFGFNRPCVKNFGQSDQVIVTGSDNETCPVGFDKLYPHFGMAAHNGLDLMAGEQSVYAAHSGTVIEMQTVPSRGLGIGILTDEAVDLDGMGSHFVKVRYWHLKSFNVKVGDHVEVGDIIGISDNTGYSSGDHLHLEINPMDKDAGGHPYYVYGDGEVNGVQVIAAAISPEPYLIGQYAQDQRPLTPSDKIAILAADDQAKGDTKNANILYAVAKILKAFGN